MPATPTTTPPLSMARMPDTSSGGALDRLAGVFRRIQLPSLHASPRRTAGGEFRLGMASTLIAMMTSIHGNKRLGARRINADNAL